MNTLIAYVFVMYVIMTRMVYIVTITGIHFYHVTLMIFLYNNVETNFQ